MFVRTKSVEKIPLELRWEDICVFNWDRGFEVKLGCSDNDEASYEGAFQSHIESLKRRN